MNLVERHDQLEILRKLLDDCLEGNGSVAVISGAVASGKTALLHAFAERAAESGAHFLHATASRAERDLSLGVIGQLLVGASCPAGSDEYAMRLLDIGALAAPPCETDVQGALNVHVLRELGEVLLSAAEKGPVVIGVDDIHHADRPSLECLLYVVRRLRRTRIVLALTECVSFKREHQCFYAELLRQPHCHRVELPLISQHGIAEMINQSMAPRELHELASACYEVSGGNPLLAGALIEDYRSSGTGSVLIPGDAFGEAVSTCLYLCQPSMIAVAKAAAVLSDHASPTVLGEVLDLDHESVHQAVKGLSASGLLASGRFRHEAARAAVLRTLGGAEREALHGRAARVLHSRGSHVAVVAREILAAGSLDAAWTMPVLREAADYALADDDVRLAITYLLAAHKACTAEDQRMAIKASLVRAEWRIDPSAAARHLPELTTAALEGRLPWRDAVVLLSYLLWYGNPEQAAEVLESVERRNNGPASLGAKATEALEVVRMWMNFTYPEFGSRVRQDRICPAPDAGAPTHGVPMPSATLLGTLFAQHAGAGAVRGAELILHGSRLDEGAMPSIVAALALYILTGRLDEAAPWCDALLKEAADRHCLMWQAMFAAIRSTIEIRQGRLDAAAESAEAALTLVTPKSWGVAIGIPIANAVLAATAKGNYKEAAAAYLSMPVPEGMFGTFAALPYLQARGRYYLALHHYRAALADFQTCGNLMAKWQLDLPAFVPWRTDAAEVWLRLGNRCKARNLAEEQLARVGPQRSPVRAVCLRVLAATSEAKHRLPLLSEAAETLQECGSLLELALTVADLGRAHHALGNDSQARMLNRRADQLAKACGGDVAGIADVAGAVGAVAAAAAHGSAGTGQIAQLSEAELRVAALAAQGHTNRQIASKLFITVSTVEQHLTRVYRKLHARRRADLPAELQRGIPGSSASMPSKPGRAWRRVRPGHLGVKPGGDISSHRPSGLHNVLSEEPQG